MSELKCPFCNSKLSDVSLDYDWKCEKCSLAADLEVWQELIRTRKALDVAKDALKKIGFGDGVPPDENYAYNYINIAADAHHQIKELEQKDK